MNDDLKAYIDGELPPDAAERLRDALEADPALRAEEAALRGLTEAIRRMPAPEPVGQAATLAALGGRRPSLVRGWAFALAGCAAVLFLASSLPRPDRRSPVTTTTIERTAVTSTVEPSIPAVRREAFERYVRERGGQVRRDGDGLRAFYPEGAHEPLKRRFLLPDDLPWPADGLRVRLDP